MPGVPDDLTGEWLPFWRVSLSHFLPSPQAATGTCFRGFRDGEASWSSILRAEKGGFPMARPRAAGIDHYQLKIEPQDVDNAILSGQNVQYPVKVVQSAAL